MREGKESSRVAALVRLTRGGIRALQGVRFGAVPRAGSPEPTRGTGTPADRPHLTVRNELTGFEPVTPVFYWCSTRLSYSSFGTDDGL